MSQVAHLLGTVEGAEPTPFTMSHRESPNPSAKAGREAKLGNLYQDQGLVFAGGDGGFVNPSNLADKVWG